MNIIDSHHHLWIPEQYEPDLGYAWLRDIGAIKPFGDPTPIQRDYIWSEYHAESTAHSLDGSIYVQVDGAIADAVNEVAWVASEFAQSNAKHAIVALTNLSNVDAEATLAALSKVPYVCGIRHILSRQDNNPTLSFAGEHFLRNNQWRSNYALLKSFNFSFDLQLYPEQMAEAAEFISQHPHTPVIIDHAGSPYDQSQTGLKKLADGLQLLAQLPNVSIKLSGFGMFDQNWSAASVQAIVNCIVDTFGDRRVMYGSNFPVDKLMNTYDYGIEQLLLALQDLPESSLQHIFKNNAAQAYRLA